MPIMRNKEDSIKGERPIFDLQFSQTRKLPENDPGHFSHECLCFISLLS